MTPETAAPAEMPGVEEIARAARLDDEAACLEKLADESFCPFQRQRFRDEAVDLRADEAVIRIFARAAAIRAEGE